MLIVTYDMVLQARLQHDLEALTDEFEQVRIELQKSGKVAADKGRALRELLEAATEEVVSCICMYVWACVCVCVCVFA